MTIDYRKVQIYQGCHKLLGDVDFQANTGEMIYLVGSVGSGKTSFLKTIYGELGCEGERAHVLDVDMQTIRSSQLPFLRRQIGMIFQDFKLLPDYSVYYNLEYILKATGWKDKEERNQRIQEVLAMVRMEKKSSSMTYQLSGGEKQRICVARALLNHPRLILADEPTGNLDPENGELVLAMLDEIRRQHHTTVIVSTHNMQWLKYFPGTIYHTNSGKLVKEDDAGAIFLNNTYPIE